MFVLVVISSRFAVHVTQKRMRVVVTSLAQIKTHSKGGGDCICHSEGGQEFTCVISLFIKCDTHATTTSNCHKKEYVFFRKEIQPLQGVPNRETLPGQGAGKRVTRRKESGNVVSWVVAARLKMQIGVLSHLHVPSNFLEKSAQSLETPSAKKKKSGSQRKTGWSV